MAPLNLDRALDQILENSPRRLGIPPKSSAVSCTPALAHPQRSVTFADHVGRALTEVYEIPMKQDEHDSAEDIQDAPAAAPRPGFAMIPGWTYPFQPGSGTGYNAILEETTGTGSYMEWQSEMTVEVSMLSIVGASWQPQQVHSTQLAQDDEVYETMSICDSDSGDAMFIRDSNSCEAMLLCGTNSGGLFEKESKSELDLLESSAANFLNHDEDPLATARLQPSGLDASPTSKRWGFILEEMIAQDAVDYELVGRDDRVALYRFKLERLVLRRSEGSMRPSNAYVEALQRLEREEALGAQAQILQQTGYLQEHARLWEKAVHGERELQQSKMKALMATAKQKVLRALDSRRETKTYDSSRSDRSTRTMTGRVERPRELQRRSRLGRYAVQNG